MDVFKQLPDPEVPLIDDPRKFSTEQIVRHYYRLLVRMAAQQHLPDHHEDLISEGVVGLLEAIERWDPEKAKSPKNFHQLAIVRIKGAMSDYKSRNALGGMGTGEHTRRGLSYFRALQNYLQPFEDPTHLLTCPIGELPPDLPADVRDHIDQRKHRIHRALTPYPTNTPYETVAQRLLLYDADVSAAGKDSYNPTQRIEDEYDLLQIEQALSPARREALARMEDSVTDFAAEAGISRQASNIRRQAIARTAKRMRNCDKPAPLPRGVRREGKKYRARVAHPHRKKQQVDLGLFHTVVSAVRAINKFRRECVQGE